MREVRVRGRKGGKAIPRGGALPGEGLPGHTVHPSQGPVLSEMASLLQGRGWPWALGAELCVFRLCQRGAPE